MQGDAGPFLLFYFLTAWLLSVSLCVHLEKHTADRAS